MNCSNEKEREKIREDFIFTLQNLIKRGNIGSTFQVIPIPNHISEKITDNEKAELLRQKCKAHFFLYGRVRLREINNKKFHIIDLDGIVSHKPIPKEVSRIIFWMKNMCLKCFHEGEVKSYGKYTDDH